jgi:hypothetical protein
VIGGTIIFTNEEDQPIWQYETKGVYSSCSLYNVIKFRGVQPIYLLVFWKLKIPPRI